MRSSKVEEHEDEDDNLDDVLAGTTWFRKLTSVFRNLPDRQKYLLREVCSALLGIGLFFLVIYFAMWIVRGFVWGVEIILSLVTVWDILLWSIETYPGIPAFFAVALVFSITMGCLSPCRSHKRKNKKN